MTKNKNVFTLIKEGNEVDAEIISSFSLGNGKNYILYQIDGEQGIYASVLNENGDNSFELDDVDDEDMEVINELIDRIAKEGK